MPVGMQCADAANGTYFDITTMTGRVLGSRTIASGSVPYLEAITIPVSSGKAPWFFHMVAGNMAAYTYRNTGQATNAFTIQIDGPAKGTKSGTVYVWYGEE